MWNEEHLREARELRNWILDWLGKTQLKSLDWPILDAKIASALSDAEQRVRQDIALQLYRMCLNRGDAANGSLVWAEIRQVTGTVLSGDD